MQDGFDIFPSKSMPLQIYATTFSLLFQTQEGILVHL